MTFAAGRPGGGSRLRAGHLVRQEVAAAIRGDGPAVWCAAALVAGALAVLGGRRLAQGELTQPVALEVTQLLLRELLPLLVTVAAGIRYVQRRDQGLDRDLHLAGLRPGHLLLVVVADAMLLLAGAWLATPVAVLAGAGSVSDVLPDLLRALVGLGLEVAFLALFSGTLAQLSTSRSGFVLAGVGLVGSGSLFYWGGQVYPSIAVVADLWPWHAAGVFLATRDDRQWQLGVAAVAVASVACVAVLVRTRSSFVVSGSSRPGVAGGSGPAGAGSAGGIGRWAMLAAFAVIWGFAVPATLSPYVPWYLRPQWLAQVERHRASPDVAARWLSAVLAGDDGTARAVATGPPAAVAGPLLPLLARIDPTTAAVDASSDGDPGSVSVDERDEVGTVTGLRLYVCLHPDADSWRVTGVRSADDCPREAR